MRFDLDHQRVIVFGAAQGIGRAIAIAFREQGCEVIGVDRKRPENPPCEFEVCDVTDGQAIERLRQTHGDVRHVVFSVGVSSGAAGFPFWNVPTDRWADVIQVNLIGAVNVATAFAPGMAASGCGTFLFLTSVAGQIGSQTDPPYSAAKAGLINFVQCAAKDLAPSGVRVNAISPGMVQTELNREVWRATQAATPDADRPTYEQWADEKVRRVSPLARWQSPEEIAAMAVFLASEHARNITGQTINIDGGQVMHS